MKKCTAIIAALALTVMAGGLLAQTATHTVNVGVNGIQIIRVNSGSAITLTIVAPGTSGAAPSDVTDATQYLQYTVIKVGSATYKVTGKITAGTVPNGVTLYVAAANAGAGGAGTKGTGAGEKALPSGAVPATDLITGIGSCYTATGVADGSQLTYRLSVTDWGTIAEASSTALTVTYTITT
jgi:hypothetical protein